MSRAKKVTLKSLRRRYVGKVCASASLDVCDGPKKVEVEKLFITDIREDPGWSSRTDTIDIMAERIPKGNDDAICLYTEIYFREDAVGRQLALDRVAAFLNELSDNKCVRYAEDLDRFYIVYSFGWRSNKEMEAAIRKKFEEVAQDAIEAYKKRWTWE